MVGLFVRFLLFTRCEGSLLTRSLAALTRSFNDPSQLVNKNRTHSLTMK